VAVQRQHTGNPQQPRKQCFAAADPKLWNSLLVYLRLINVDFEECYRHYCLGVKIMALRDVSVYLLLACGVVDNNGEWWTSGVGSYHENNDIREAPLDDIESTQSAVCLSQQQGRHC